MPRRVKFACIEWMLLLTAFAAGTVDIMAVVILPFAALAIAFTVNRRSRPAA